MLFKEFEVNSKVYYFYKFIIILLLIIIIYKYYFGFNFNFNFNSNSNSNLENFTNNFEAEKNISSVFNENNLIVGDLVIKNSFNMLPRGSIVAWRTLDGKPPTGWAMCNGENETPDLRGRFIVGSGLGEGLTERNNGEVGGEEKHVLQENEIPPHGHSISIFSDFSVVYDVYLSGPGCTTVLAGNSLPHFATNNPNDENKKEFVSQGHNNMPPFFITYYIMKL